MNKGQHVHNGTTFETLHFRYFVRCELCGRWRLRQRDDLFWRMSRRVHWTLRLRAWLKSAMKPQRAE